jgi:hypothetical protein
MSKTKAIFKRKLRKFCYDVVIAMGNSVKPNEQWDQAKEFHFAFEMIWKMLQERKEAN